MLIVNFLLIIFCIKVGNFIYILLYFYIKVVNESINLFIFFIFVGKIFLFIISVYMVNVL